jgi:hypothetical protein
VTEAARNSADVDAAAQIWAEATAARDGDKEVAELRFSRSVIQEVLDRSPRSVQLVDRAADGTATGFAAAEPLPGADTVAQLTSPKDRQARAALRADLEMRSGGPADLAGA